MDVVSFQKKWIGASNLKERTASQSHFNDLCELLDVPKPTDVDFIGDEYTFERGASITAGGNGWADVWKKGHFAWEYKGQGKDLDAAYMQLLRYKDDLGNPPLMVVSDLNIIRIHTNFTNTVKKVYEYDLNTLNEPGVLRTLKYLWTDPQALRPRQTPDELTAEAAGVFADVTSGLYDRGQHPETTAHFLVQVVFSLFAEDIGLLPDRIFSEVAEADRNQPQQFQEDVTKLFTAMQDGGRVFLKKIPHVNGGLFQNVNVPMLEPAEIEAIYTATKLDWSQIEPAIFGTLFERALDPTKRSQLGAHYTGMADIERVVKPVVMAPLQREWDEIQAEIAGGKLSSKKQRGKPKSKAEERIDQFLAHLRSVTVLDPACGSGNFLYVALKELLTLEKEVMTWRAMNLGTPLGLPEVSPRQIKGIEINIHAQQLAQTAIWIGHLQWMNDNGFGWVEPVLDELSSIEHKDALLTFHEDGTVTETEWPPATFIIGNPPFLGGYRIRRELGDDYSAQLRRVFGSSLPSTVDLVCYFFEKALSRVVEHRTMRVGLLATNAIRNDDNRIVLERIVDEAAIVNAWSNEPWTLDGANVRISIVCFQLETKEMPTLNGTQVSHINPDLTADLFNITTVSQLHENAHISYMGTSKKGAFDLDPATAKKMLDAPINVNGRHNSEVVRPWFNAKAITSRWPGTHIIDFGSHMSESEASLFEQPFEYLREHVKPVRLLNNRKSYRDRWWLHAEARPALRSAIKSLSRFLVTPIVSKHRVFVWLSKASAPDQKLFVFARDDDYFMGIMSARPHTTWALRLGPLHGGNTPIYTGAGSFETYPFPWPPGQEPVDDPVVQRISAAAKDLDDKRNAWLNPEGATEAQLKKRTLTNLYNENPTWLRNLHATLDRAVWDAYGWPADEVPAEVEEDAVLSRLLALNLERSVNQT